MNPVTVNHIPLISISYSYGNLIRETKPATTSCFQVYADRSTTSCMSASLKYKLATLEAQLQNYLPVDLGCYPPKRTTRTSLCSRQAEREETAKHLPASGELDLESSQEAQEEAKVAFLDCANEIANPVIDENSPVERDEEVMGITNRKTRRKLTDAQRDALEDLVELGIAPSLETRRTLADKLGL